MIFLFPLMALSVAVFLPWPYVAVVGAIWGVAGQNQSQFGRSELFQATLMYLGFHAVVAWILDFVGEGLVATRIAAVFSIPLPPLVYVLSGIPSCLLFLVSVWVVRSGKDLVRR